MPNGTVAAPVAFVVVVAAAESALLSVLAPLSLAAAAVAVT